MCKWHLRSRDQGKIFRSFILCKCHLLSITWCEVHRKSDYILSDWGSRFYNDIVNIIYICGNNVILVSICLYHWQLNYIEESMNDRNPLVAQKSVWKKIAKKKIKCIVPTWCGTKLSTLQWPRVLLEFLFIATTYMSGMHANYITFHP